MPGNESREGRDLAKTGAAVASVVKTIVGEAARAIEKGGAEKGTDETSEKERGAEKSDGDEKGVGEAVAAQGLSEGQRRALESMAMGHTVMETSRRAGVARSTIYEWLRHDAVFRAAYNKWHNMLDEACRARMKTLLDKATRTVEKAMDGGDAKVAMELLKGAGMVKVSRAKTTDPEVLKRKKEVKKMDVEAKLKERERYARSRARGFTTPFSELR